MKTLDKILAPVELATIKDTRIIVINELGVWIEEAKDINEVMKLWNGDNYGTK